ncbi:MAG: hypothetical protein RSP_05080 [Rhodanobacter sp.]
MSYTKIAATALAVALLAACSKSAPNTAAPASQPTLSGALAPAAVQQAAQTAKAASLPQPDWSTPDSTYVEITKGPQVMFLDAAFSGMPPNYDKMAQIYSSAYRMESDAFKKHDLLTAIQPKLDAGIADAKAHPYITWTDNTPQLGPYDFGTHSFPDNSALFSPTGYMSFSDAYGYNLGVTNGSAFQRFVVPDEAKARAIEGLRGQWQALHFKIFAFVQGTDESQTPTVQAVITKVQILDKNGQVLFEQAAPH